MLWIEGVAIFPVIMSYISKMKISLCISKDRTVRNDRIIAYNSKLYQMGEPALSKKVVVEDRIDGKMLIV
jgi:hypothetical protein